MSHKPFPAPYKKLKDVGVGYFEDCIGREPNYIQGKTAIYLDPRGDTSFVAAMPDHYAKFFGSYIPLFRQEPIDRDPKTGTYFVRTKSSLDTMEKLLRAIGREFYERVLHASRVKVIAYTVAYVARDADGRSVSKGQPSFQEIPVLGFHYGVRYLVDNKLYELEIVEDADDHEKETLSTTNFSNDRFHAGQTIVWSAEAEAACAAFKASIEGIGQRMHDFFGQPPEALKLALESRINPLLAAPEKTHE
jgi:hypothetical protein